jgi:hypothetical protein
MQYQHIHTHAHTHTHTHTHTWHALRTQTTYNIRTNNELLRLTVTCKTNGNRSDGVPVVIWYKDPLKTVENSCLFCNSQYHMLYIAAA